MHITTKLLRFDDTIQPPYSGHILEVNVRWALQRGSTVHETQTHTHTLVHSLPDEQQYGNNAISIVAVNCSIQQSSLFNWRLEPLQTICLLHNHDIIIGTTSKMTDLP